MIDLARAFVLVVIAGLTAPFAASQVDTVLPDHGTVGTQVEVTGAGFGTGKPKAWLQDDATGKKHALKVLPGFGDTGFSAEIRKAVLGAAHLWVQPKGADAIDAGAFTVDAPSVSALQDAQLQPLVSVEPGDTFYIAGDAFGTKKGKVIANGIKLKVITWGMSGILCESSPKLANGVWPLTVLNKVSDDSFESLVQEGSFTKLGKLSLTFKKDGQDMNLKVGGAVDAQGYALAFGATNGGNPNKQFVMLLPFTDGAAVPATYVYGTDTFVATYAEFPKITSPYPPFPLPSTWWPANGFTVTINANSGGQVAGTFSGPWALQSGPGADITVEGSFIAEF